MAGKKIIDGAIELTGDLTGGHITGTLLQSTQHTDLNKTPGSYPVFDDSGLIYSRTAEETKADLGITDKANANELSMVAFTGNYQDLDDTPTIPTNTSELKNDSGFLTSAPVTSVNGQTGAVTVPTYYVATSTSNGLMSSGDKKKVDYIQNTQLGVSIGENAYNAGHSGANDIMLGKNATQSGNDVDCSKSAENSAIAIGHYANAYGVHGINIGTPRQSTNTSQFGAKAPSAIAIGTDALASNEGSIAVGDGAKSSANYAVQIGTGTNSTADTLQFRDYQLLNENGQVPAERTLEGIAIDFDSANMTVSTCNANGISIAMPEIEFDAGDGGLAYGKGDMTLPIVAGNGISITATDNNKAEISVERKPYTVYFSLGSAVYITMLAYSSKEENKTIGSGTRAELLSRLLEILFERGTTMPMVIGRYQYYNIVTAMIAAKDTLYIEYLQGTTLKTTNLTINSSSNVTSFIVTPMA